jgi:hypothetical protein
MDELEHRARKRARLEDAQARAERARQRARIARRGVDAAPSPLVATARRCEQAVHEQAERLHLAAAGLQEEHLAEEEGRSATRVDAGGHDGGGV